MEAGEYELALKAYYRAGSEIGINSDVLSAIGSADLKLGRLNQAAFHDFRHRCCLSSR